MRRTGVTTRIVDRCIQEFFKNGKTFIYERHSDLSTQNAYDVFVKRMYSEHSNAKFTSSFQTVDGIKCWVIEKHNL